jgi:uncharacterized membrane protein YgdD (TMEM256/DUF423 family)
MTAVASPQQNVYPVSSQTRNRAAILLPIGPLIMLAGYVAMQGKGYDAQSWSVFFDLLSTPFLLITATIAAAASWRAAPRTSVVALTGLVCNIIGLAALHGMEAFQLVMEHSGTDKAALDSAFEAFATLPVGLLEIVLFLGGNLVGSAALLLAQFRTSTLPWHVPILSLVAVAADFTIPDSAPPLVKSAGISLFVAWSIALAIAIRRPTQRAPLRKRPPTTP